MPDQMYLDLKDQLPALKEALLAGAKWGSEIAGRYIQYDIACNIIWILLAIIMLYVAIKLKEHAKRWYDKEYNPMGYVGMVLLSVCSPLIFFLSIFTIVKDIFIPEIRILEMLSNLIN